MINEKQIYQSINAISRKVNDAKSSAIIYSEFRADNNEQNIRETQNAIIEVDESRLQAEADAENALIELDAEINDRLSDIENALCELTTE